MRKFIRKRRGHFRIIEVLIAVVALFTAFTTSVFLTSTSRINVLQEHSDLDRVGQNILLRLAESGVIDSTVKMTPKGPSLEPYVLENTVTKSLPPLTYYILRIYNYTGTDKIPIFTNEIGNVTNTTPNAFPSTSEVSSSSFIYTSASGQIYYIVLTLAKAG